MGLISEAMVLHSGDGDAENVRPDLSSGLTKMNRICVSESVLFQILNVNFINTDVV